MSKAKTNLFFYRIEPAGLMDFATDPDGASITLLAFAKELQKGASSIPFIQAIIDEAHSYLEGQSKHGKEGAQKRWGKPKVPE